jgi:hypothetical protein
MASRTGRDAARTFPPTGEHLEPGVVAVRWDCDERGQRSGRAVAPHGHVPGLAAGLMDFEVLAEGTSHAGDEFKCTPRLADCAKGRTMVTCLVGGIENGKGSGLEYAHLGEQVASMGHVGGVSSTGQGSW